MAYEFDDTFLTILKDKSTEKPRSKSEDNVASSLSQSATPELSPTSPNSTLNLATEIKIAFDLIVETGLGQKRENNRSRRRTAWERNLDPSKVKNAQNHFVPIGSQLDSLDQFLDSTKTGTQTTSLFEKRKASIGTDAKLTQDSPAESPNQSSNLAAREREPRLTAERPKKALQFVKTSPPPRLTTLAPPKQPEAMNLALEAAHPNSNSNSNRVIHPMSRRSNGKS